MTDMTLGQNICRLRTERGLSQGDLADALDVSRQSISKWETDASVPELEKLLRLSGLFQVSLDELVKGPAPEAAPKNSPGGTEAPIPPEGKPLQRDDADLLPALDRGVNRILGLVLLGFGALLTILLAVLGGGLTGLVLSLPLFLCGVICLAARKRPGLWCAWVCSILLLAYLRHATGIRWTNIFQTFSWTPEMNYLRLAFAWAMSLGMLALLIGTVRSFRDQRIPWGRRAAGKYAALWALYLAGRWAVNRFVFAAWAQRIFPPGEYDHQGAVAYGIGSILWEILLLVVLAVLLVKTAALLWGRKAAKVESEN